MINDFGVVFKKEESSSIVFTFGVSIAFTSSVVATPSSQSFAQAAFSVFAAYPQVGQIISVSSPTSLSTMNSSEPVPPIAPESARTGITVSPRRLKILR